MATILIVDDYLTHREFLLKLLDNREHCLLEAGDSAEALALVKARRPDLIIADIRILAMNDYALVRQLHADPDIAAVAITFSTDPVRQQGAEALAGSCNSGIMATGLCEPGHSFHVVADRQQVARLEVEMDQRRRFQEALAESEKRFRQMAENIRDVFFLIDADNRHILYVSPAYEEIWGRSCGSLYANPTSWTEAIHPEDRQATDEKIEQGMLAGAFEYEYRIVRPDGTVRCIEARGFPVRDAEGRIMRIAGVAKDITDRKEAEARIAYLNRVYAMLSDINALIVRVRNRDELFREACRIAVEEGGFQIALIGIVDSALEKIVPVASAGLTEERLAVLAERFTLKEGVSLESGVAARAISKKRAVVSNEVGGHRYLFYTRKMTAAVAGKLTLENQLRQALDNGEFELHYQPKVNLGSGRITGAEALIRWNDPRTGLVSPGRFIPVLEEIGLIYEVGRWAQRKAIEDYLHWCKAGLAAVRIAVNVSPLQLRHRSFIADIEQAIGIDEQAAAGLELEITESLIMEDVKNSIANLREIRAIGVNIAIDDFGMGFSSLSYLSKLPVDTLKIDRSFVIDMTTGPEGLALVTTIINLAHSLALKVVAEGVETEEQASLLRLLNCDDMQGFLFSKAVPRAIFEESFLTPSAAG